MGCISLRWCDGNAAKTLSDKQIREGLKVLSLDANFTVNILRCIMKVDSRSSKLCP